MRFDEAKKRISDRVSSKPVGAERIPLSEAVGRVLAKDVVSPINVPLFNKSTVDGYAVRAEDTIGAREDNQILLKAVGHSKIGEAPKITLGKGCAIGIATGGALPTHANAVIMLENTMMEKKNLAVFKAVAKGENVMKSGSDIRKGETILRKGAPLSSRKIGVLASIGLASVDVFRQPKVAVISTGPEIVELGRSLRFGKTYDVNRYALMAAILESGGKPLDFGILEEDDEKLLVKTLREAARTADIVVTSGGVSIGPKDIMPKLADELGSPGLMIHGVAVKPGKPLSVAVVDKKPIFLLPGHPTSSLLMFHLLVRPIILQAGGRGEEPQTPIEAVTSEKLFSARGRRTFVMVILSGEDEGRLQVHRVQTGLSGAITTIANADGYVVLREEDQFIDAGEKVSVFPF
jgi:putative molybdopterin biosynthesis protein